MEDQVNRLVDKTWEKYRKLTGSKRLLIGVAGIPGSGKTTLAAEVVNGVNKKFRSTSPGIASGQEHPLAAFIPMDGYHLTRAHLDAMPDPTNAHARRGAAFTFDASSYHDLIKRLREPLTPETKTLHAPSFDHAVKDPVENDIAIPVGARVLIFEGNYIALDEDVWRDAAALMDEIWFVEVDDDVARERLVARHVKAGIAKDEAEGRKRADENDLVNGKEIKEKKLKVDETIESLEDESWRAEK